MSTKHDIMITKLFKNNSHRSNNEYYNLESIFEKLRNYFPHILFRKGNA